MTRTAGVLLHPTSLPSRYGIGDLGPGAHRYLEWLAEAGIGWWQILPLHPPGPGQSPYSAISTFAGNQWLISPDVLVQDGLLDQEALEGVPAFPAGQVAFDDVLPFKGELLGRAFHRFREQPPPLIAAGLETFRDRQSAWLGDFALYLALKRAHGSAPWYEWPPELAGRDPQALARWRAAHAEEVELVEFSQFLFFRQWRAVRVRAEELGVKILGDVPIFVAHDSADVWSHPELFKLDGELRPTVVAGVPPDYFSATGQLWGNPVYDWERLAADGYAWWIERLGHELTLTDAVRLDHFRGFAAYWEVPAGEDTAVNGRWAPGPGRALFDAVREAVGKLPLVAEDLGEITPDVIELRKELGLPGMAILQFAFSPHFRSSFIPYALERDMVVYTGTHDNNTSVGWYWEDAGEGERDLLRRYVASSGQEIHWDMVRLALGTVCDQAVVPHQDLVGVGSDCRMNTPARGLGNWRFRITPWMLEDPIRERLAELVWVYGRQPVKAEGDEGGATAHRAEEG